MIVEISIKKARSIVYRMLSARARTYQQVFTALRQKGATDEIVLQVMEELLQFGYINDREYAENYIRTKLESKPYGALYLRIKLEQSGVERSLAREIVQEMVTPREHELAVSFVKLLLARGETLPQKAVNKLINRGFSFTVAHRAVEEEFSAYLDMMT